MSIHEVSDDIEGLSASGSAPVVATTDDVPIQVENIQQGAAPQPAQTKTFFGLAQDSRRQGFSRPVFNDDYVERFPEDAYGQETAPNARIWRVYVEEAAAFDENMVGQSRDGLDVMLVFAGLFSAVVTSFLVQVSQNLQADFSEMSALLLHDLLIVQLSMADGAMMNVTTPSVNPAQKFDPDAIDVWINGFWVVSLTASLVVALAAVLVKQWLHRYMIFPSGTPELRSHVRQFRFLGFEKWRVRIIIGMLPIIMHISLMLFFAGLALFYIPLRASLAWAVGTITVLVCMLYLVSNAIPIIFPECPYQTPLTDFIHHICQVVPFGIRAMRLYCFVAYRGIRKGTVPSQQQSSVAAEIELGPNGLQHNLLSLAQSESHVVQGAHDTLSVDALDWLYHMSSNPTVRTLVLQGISGLPDASHSHAARKWSGATDMQTERRRLVREGSQSHDVSVVERLCRSHLFLPKGNEEIYALADALSELTGDLDPRVVAAQSLAIGFLYLIPKNFFLQQTDVLIHPLLWEDVIGSVLHDICIPPYMFGFRCFDESSFAQFLSLVVSPPSATIPSASLMTATQVIWARLGPQFWATLLTAPLLAPHDSAVVAPISLYHRTLIAAGRLALSHVREHRDDMDHFTTAQCQHLNLLGCVLRLVTDTESETRPTPVQWRVDFDFLFSVVELLGDVFSASTLEESPNDITFFRSCLDDVRSFYLWSSTSPEFHFPRLDFVLHTWASFDDSSQAFYNSSHFDPDFTFTRMSDLRKAMGIIGHALSGGREEAYRIFLDEDWMRIAFTEWAICGDSGAYVRIIESYVKGLQALTSTSSRRNFCEYLYQPRQLILAFMLILAATPQYYVYVTNRLQDHVVQLAKICPTHTSWKDCDAALTAIVAWAQSPNLETDLFPWPPSLQSLCTTATFPVAQAIARHFSLPYKQPILMLALDTLHAVLENAECVDGVMIPDLETKTDVDAVSPPSCHLPAMDLSCSRTAAAY